MGLMMSEGKFVGRDEIALVPTPEATASWKPVPHRCMPSEPHLEILPK